MLDRAGDCRLCGLPLPRNPVVRSLNGEPTRFCCEGCARVYEVAQQTGMLDQVLLRTKPKSRETPREKSLPGIAKLRVKESAFFDIDGMWCAGCALSAERVLQGQPGVQEVTVSFASQRGRIEYDPQQVDLDALVKRLTPLGYQVSITSSKEEQQKERFQNRIGLQLMAATAFGMEIMVLYLVQLYPMYALGQSHSMEARRIQYIVWTMATPVVFYGGLTFWVGTLRSLQAKAIGMDALVSLGVLSAYLYSVYVTLTGNGQTYFDTAAMIVDFILIGRYLEAVGGAQARKDLRSLLRLQPELAWNRPGAGEEWRQVNVETLTVGDEILVKPGERVPVDARVLSGEATVDESLLTGESLPVTKKTNDAIYAGTILREGALIGQVAQGVENTRLAQITELVNKTLGQKPRIQRLADRVSTYFTYAILLLAVLTATGWYLQTQSVGAALLAAVAVLVVACPCALGLATPLAIAVTMGQAARHGILVRNPDAMETSAAIQRIAFDKTGTLTRGHLDLVEVIPAQRADMDQDQLLRLAASVEQFSEHPLARAIHQAASGPLLETDEFMTLRGIGASARVRMDHQQVRISVGSTRLVDPHSEPGLIEIARQREAQGETVVWIAWDGNPVGIISLRDQPSPTGRKAIEKLKAAGIQVAMLSGDSPITAQAIARELNIDDFEGRCAPEEKAAIIAGWQQEGLRVGMAGDGVNDAPALAQANLSITVAGGTDIAGQASDLVLTRFDLALIPWFIRLSRKNRRTVIQNLGWAFGYNLIAVPLAMLGLISPVIAAAAMAVSSLLVVINSLRLRHT